MTTSVTAQPTQTRGVQSRRVPEGAAFSVIMALSFSHFLNDMMQSLVPALYPMLKGTYGLSFAQIGLITLFMQLTSSLLQPMVGLISDHRPQPYSLAVVMRETLAHLNHWDIKLLATDIDSKVVATAAEGVYGAERFKGVSAQRVKDWFPQASGRPGCFIKPAWTCWTGCIACTCSRRSRYPMRRLKISWRGRMPTGAAASSMCPQWRASSNRPAASATTPPRPG